MPQLRYSTSHGISVTRTSSTLPFSRGLQSLMKQLDAKRGFYFSSGYEYPERYSRWDIACVAPPIEIVGRERTLEIRALNDRGRVLIQLLASVLESHPHWESFRREDDRLIGNLKPLPPVFAEEERSKQPSPFSILRALIHEFRNGEDTRLVLAGAFGYDLLLQFDPIDMRLPRGEQKTLHLFLCDDI
jgi:anthranilate synthase